MSVNKKSYNDQMQERGGYAIVPNEIWERSDLDHTAKVIWCYILSRKADWSSSRNNVSRNLNMHHATVTKYIAELEKLNLLKKTIGAGNSWDFEIVPPSEWVQEQPDTKTAQYIPYTTSDTPGVPDVIHPVYHTQESILTTLSSSARSMESGVSSSKKEMNIVSPAEAEGAQRKDNKIRIPTEKSSKLSPDSDVRSVGKTSIPDYEVKTSAWYQHCR